jgi:hypothetical protein
MLMLMDLVSGGALPLSHWEVGSSSSRECGCHAVGPSLPPCWSRFLARHNTDTGERGRMEGRTTLPCIFPFESREMGSHGAWPSGDCYSWSLDWRTLTLMTAISSGCASGGSYSYGHGHVRQVGPIQTGRLFCLLLGCFPVHMLVLVQLTADGIAPGAELATVSLFQRRGWREACDLQLTPDLTAWAMVLHDHKGQRTGAGNPHSRVEGRPRTGHSRRASSVSWLQDPCPTYCCCGW